MQVCVRACVQCMMQCVLKPDLLVCIALLSYTSHGRPSQPPKESMLWNTGVYGMVRHPLYTCIMMGMWITPRMVSIIPFTSNRFTGLLLLWWSRMNPSFADSRPSSDLFSVHSIHHDCSSLLWRAWFGEEIWTSLCWVHEEDTSLHPLAQLQTELQEGIVAWQAHNSIHDIYTLYTVEHIYEIMMHDPSEDLPCWFFSITNFIGCDKVKVRDSCMTLYDQFCNLKNCSI